MRVEGIGVCKRFGAIEALRGLDFVIPAGGRVGLIGPNASGKSTLIRAVLGLVRVEGNILLDGSATRDHHLAERIAYVPQIAPKFGATVGDVIRAITQVRDLPVADVVSCGRQLGINLDQLFGQSFRSLSGGAKQKTLIALALCAGPSLLVLDEPTASLDTASRGDFFRLLQTRATTSTMILCSHRLEEIRSLVDQVMVLEEGRLAYMGPTEAYLDHITLSTIEVQVTDAQFDAALLGFGFERGVAGWWRRTATRPDKLRLLEKLPQILRGGLRNIVVRDAEAVQPGQSQDCELIDERFEGAAE